MLCPRKNKFSECTSADANKCQCADETFGPCPCICHTKPMHIFEQDGLGIAPFQFVAIETRRGPIEVEPGHFVGAPGQPMGTCDHCGTGIAECCVIQDRNGKRFIVGTTCVRKTGDRGLIKHIDAATAAKRREAADKRRKKQFEENSKIVAQARFNILNSGVRVHFGNLPHPTPYYAARGLTRLDYLDFMIQLGGMSSGKVAAAKEIIKYMDENQ